MAKNWVLNCHQLQLKHFEQCKLYCQSHLLHTDHSVPIDFKQAMIGDTVDAQFTNCAIVFEGEEARILNTVIYKLICEISTQHLVNAVFASC